MADFQEIEMDGIVYEFPVDMADDQIQQVLTAERAASAEPKDLSVLDAQAGLVPTGRSENESNEDIESIINEAAESVGVPADQLLAIARAESNLKPDAKNPRSSASGLFQFIDETWKETVGTHGDKHSVMEEDRLDARSNALMGAELMKRNAVGLSKKLGREPTLSELYLAHFSGLKGAIDVLGKIEKNPDALASEVWSKAAIEANPSIFKEGIKAKDAVALLTRRATRAFKPNGTT